MNELPIIQKAYDLIKWHWLIFNRLPRAHWVAWASAALASVFVSQLRRGLRSLCDFNVPREWVQLIFGVI